MKTGKIKQITALVSLLALFSFTSACKGQPAAAPAAELLKF